MCIDVETVANRHNQQTYDLETPLGRIQRSKWLADLLPAEEAKDFRKLLSNSPSEDGTSLFLNPDGVDPAQDKVKTLWCEKVNMFFDGLRKSGAAIRTPVDPRMKTAADLRKNKALPTPRDKGAASAAW